MDIASLPQHPSQPDDRSGRGRPDRDWSVVRLRVAQLAALPALAAVIGYFWWVLFRIFGGGGFRVGTFFA